MKISRNINIKYTRIINRKFMTACAAFLLLAMVIVSAGCINDYADSVESKPCEIPSDMASSSLDFITDLKGISTSISIDLYDLADKIGDAESADEAREIGLEYYGKNVWIEKLIYYDLINGDRIRVPELADDIYITDYLPVPTQKDLEAAGGILHIDCVYIPGDGYVNANYAAVYSNDGVYKGFIILLYDSYVLFNLHPMITRADNEYGSYGCFIVDKNGKIIYSSSQEYIGESLKEDSKLYTGQSLIIDSDDKFGAYQYTSPAFYNYLRGTTDTVKITSWEEFPYYKSTYTLYLTKEVNKIEMRYDDVYTVDPGTLRDNVIKAYVYASSNSKGSTFDLINSGAFSDSVAAMDIEGKLLASSNPSMIGLNYINNRGTYGTSYTESIIYTAQQGGGYVYYTYPVEPSINTRGSQFSIGYVLPVDDDWFIFGRFSADTDVIPTDFSIRKDVTEVARVAVGDAYEYNIYYVIDKINDLKPGWSSLRSDISNEISNVGVMDMNGYVYASTYRPEFVGTVQTGYTDVYGGSTIRKMIMLAKSGGGLMCDLSENPEKEGYVDLWLYSIEPVDNYYFVQAGTIIGTYKDYLSEYLNSIN